MPTREQVRELLDSGLDYRAAGQRLGIAPGQAYLIATGVPADGSDSVTDQDAQRPGFLPSSQHLANPPHENPETREQVAAWLRARAAADAQMSTAMGQRTAEPPKTVTPDDEHPDAMTVLGRQHNQVNHLLKQLEAVPGQTAGGSAEQASARKSIIGMITVRLSEHEAIEEEHFWPAVRKALPDGEHYEDQALIQEQEAKETLTELGKLDPGSREFDEGADRLVLEVRKHVAFEEQVFLKLREAVPREELERLGATLQSAMKGEAG